MQSTRIILKGFVNSFKGSWSFKPYNLLRNTKFISNTASLHYSGKELSYNFTSAQIQERRKRYEDNVKFILEECNLLTRSQKFNKPLVLKLVNKFIKIAYLLPPSEIEKRFSNNSEFQLFLKFVADNLDKLEGVGELGATVLFLSNLGGNSIQLTDQVSNYLNKYPKLLDIPYNFLGQTLERLVITETEAADALFDNFYSQLKEKSRKMNSNEAVALFEYAQRIIIMCKPQYVKEIHQVIEKESARFNMDISSINSAKLIGLLSLYVYGHMDKFNAIVDKALNIILQDLEKLSSNKIVELVAILSQANYQNQEVYLTLEKYFVGSLSEFRISQLTTILAAFAKVKAGTDDFYMEMDRRLGFNARLANPKHFALQVYAFATSGKYRQKFFMLLSDIIQKNIDIYDAQELAKILWSYATTSTLNESLFTRIETELINKIQEITLLDAILILESYASINVTKSELIDKLAATYQNELANTKAYDSIPKLSVLPLIRVLEAMPEQLKVIVPNLSKFIIYQLRRVTADDKEFLIDLGNSLGGALSQDKEAKELIRVYLQVLKDFKETKGVQFSEKEQAEIQFLTVNLEGLTQ